MNIANSRIEHGGEKNTYYDSRELVSTNVLAFVVYSEQTENSSKEGKAEVLMMFSWQHFCSSMIHRVYLKASYIPMFHKSLTEEAISQKRGANLSACM